MTDYHPLIAKAVDGLAKNTGEARRALYERARAALVAQLRGVEPALAESDITKERLALEEAIRKVEGEAARKTLTEAPAPPARNPPRTAPPPPPRPLTGGARGQQTAFDLGTSFRRERANSGTTEFPAAANAEAPQAEIPQPPQPQVDDQAGNAEIGPPLPAAKPTARSRILEARTTTTTKATTGFKGFRNVPGDTGGSGGTIAKAAQIKREAPDPYAPTPLPRTAPVQDFTPAPLPARFAPHVEEEQSPPAEDDLLQQLQSLEPSYYDQQEEAAPRSLRAHARGAEMEEDEHEYEEVRPPRSYRGWAKAALLLIIVLAVAVAGWAYRADIAAVYHLVAPAKSQQTAQTPPPTQKFGGRVPQEEAPGQAPAAGTSPGAGNPQQGPEVAQHAVLYEADPNDPQGKRFAGSVVWRTETVSPGPGLAPELAVRADISIPERHMTVTWSLRRNTDKALPASHTIEIMFNLPPDFPGGGISNVPGILMKDSEEVRGMPLAGLAVKVTNGFFLIGLNAADADMQRNIQLLKERAWFDVLIVYNNGSRAILTLEKGPPGEHAFADAFTAWGQ
jgi:hypothetical protein